MNLHEYQAKEILARYGVPVPPGKVAYTPDEAKRIAEEFGKRVVIKAQVHVGGRGKAGGVKLADTPQEAYEKAQAILGMNIKGLTVKKVLVAEAVDIAKEYYAGLILDRSQKRVVLMLSKEGGVDIEEVAAKNPEAIHKFWIDPHKGFRPFEAREMVRRAGLEGNLNKLAQVLVASTGPTRGWTLHRRDQPPGGDHGGRRGGRRRQGRPGRQRPLPPPRPRRA